MKRAVYFVFALAVGIASCNKDDETVEFAFSHDYEFTITEDSISIDTVLAAPSTDIQSSLKEQTEQNNSLLSLVKEVHLVSINIEAIDPATQELSFLQDAELFLTSGTLAELMVASKNPVSATQGTSMDFDVEEGVDVLQYMKNTNFKFRASFHLRNKLPQATKFKITGEFSALAGVDR
jgi:hypothetical protein